MNHIEATQYIKATLAEFGLCTHASAIQLRQETWAKLHEAMNVLIEQPAQQQESVASLLVGQDSDGRYVSIAAKAHADTLPLGEYKLYISPPAQRKPLTDEQYFEIGQRHWLPSIKVEKIHKEIIEAAHGITKGGAA